MADKRLQELARGYARNEIPMESYRTQRARLLDSLAADLTAIANAAPQTEHPAPWEREPPPAWLNWLPVAVVSLALASTLYWILASS